MVICYYWNITFQNRHGNPKNDSSSIVMMTSQYQYGNPQNDSTGIVIMPLDTNTGMVIIIISVPVP